MRRDSDEPVYMISVAARLIGVHAQTLRSYEREGLLAPSRSAGRRIYSETDIERLRLIRRLVEDLGVNLAGVDVILRLNGRIDDLLTEIEGLKEDLQRERDRHLPAPRPAEPR